MTILAIDTASEWGSVVIHSRGRVVAQVERHSTTGFGHLVFPMVEEALDAAVLSLDEIDCFAAGSGPGSFTGVRVALSVAKGLAEATGKRAAGISNLRALATFTQSICRAVLLDARRGDVYAAVYDPGLEAVVPEQVTKLEPWLDALDAVAYEFVVQAGAPFLEELRNSRFGGMPVVEAPYYLAAAIAVCVEADAEAGRWEDAALLDANYVRRSDAELFWREA